MLTSLARPLEETGDMIRNSLAGFYFYADDTLFSPLSQCCWLLTFSNASQTRSALCHSDEKCDTLFIKKKKKKQWPQGDGGSGIMDESDLHFTLWKMVKFKVA